MKSLHARLDLVKDEVLTCVATFGRFKAMREYRVKDYKCFIDWLVEETHDPNYGIQPSLNVTNDQTLGDQLVDAFLRKVAHLESALSARDERIKALKWQLEHSRGKQDQQALAIIEMCKP